MKILIKLVVALIAIVVIVIVAAFYFIDHIAKAGIEGGATYALGVETTLDEADVGVFSAEFSMAGLNVSNPEGFDTSHFFNLSSGGTKVDLNTLRSDTVKLPHLTLAGLDMNLEKKGGKSNYDVILDNLKRLESGEKPEAESGEGKDFVIEEVIITDVNVHVDMLPVGGEISRVVVPIDEIRLTNVGTGEDGGVKFSELFGVLLKAVLMAVVQNGADLPGEIVGELQNGLAGLRPLGDMGVGVVTEIGGQLQDITGQFEGVVEGAGDIGEGLGEVGEEVEGALKGLGDLFGGDKKDKDEND
ncbi:MAG: hypothetical protein JSV91_02850 [Phycisphaerales bacterium]|nr:MAG: hypothetical protein JSV91_02850 [Phycisphaerales bacterium]